MSISACEFISGCFGGAAGILIGHPLDTIKTWQQATNKGILKAMYKIVVRNRGINGFYRGMSFPLFTTGAANSLMFGVYGNRLRWLQDTCETTRERQAMHMQHVFLAGTEAGFVQSFIANPTELIKIKLQTHTYYRPAEATTIRSYVRYLINRHGYMFMFRGLPLTIGRDVLPYGVYMYAYVALMQALKQLPIFAEMSRQHDVVASEPGVVVVSPYHENIMLSAVAGAVAGFVGCAIVIPFDVMKTKMQADDSFRSSWHCVMDTHRRYGFKSMFRGGYMVLMRSIPVNAATFVGYEWAIGKCHDAMPG